MFLHQLKSPKGSRRRKVLRGRGPASGLGKTSGRGDKGQRSRSGRGIILGSEGGQMPLIRRLPKVGFNTHNPIVYQVVKLVDLNKLDVKVPVDVAVLKSSGLVSSSRKPVKILGDGDITKALTVRVDKFSASAAEKIQKAGGRAEVVVKNDVSVEKTSKKGVKK